MAFGKFKSIQAAITRLTREMSALQLEGCVNYFTSKFNIDGEYYRYWLSGDVEDLAELIVLYLPDTQRSAVISDISGLRQLLDEAWR
jgi:hypothetical protein